MATFVKIFFRNVTHFSDVLGFVISVKIMFVVCHKFIVRVQPVHLMIVEQHQVAIDPQTKPTNLDYESASRLL